MFAWQHQNTEFPKEGGGMREAILEYKNAMYDIESK